ncbi:TIE1 [Branchiostoma lanceolatum]|uniref:receptor protein-tyrosine kinase n=1 Tax=Branchiostoma lanceolatum TaxID=7740 RepID=A0A8K0E5Q5_BRALA|nr:TIE1 [Branchiostoma lanceolatum]
MPAPENGAISGGTDYNDEVQFTCNHGYQLIGGSSRKCMSNAEWSGENPTCIVSSDTTPTPVPAVATSSDPPEGVSSTIAPTPVHAVATSSDPPEREFCSQNSCPAYETCINEANGYSCAYCPRLSAPENGAISGGRAYNNVVQFTCNHGYQLMGKSSLVCRADTAWSGESPTCIVSSTITPTSILTVATSSNTPERVPTVPQNVKLTNLSWSELRVTWNDPDNFVGPNRGYVISLFTTESSDVVKDGIKVAKYSTEYSFSGLEAATSYTVEVRAANVRNTGPPGNATARTSDGFPSSPTNINRQEEDTHCNISWSSPMVPRGDIIGFKVHVHGHYKTDDGEREKSEYNVKSITSTNIRLMKSTKTEILDLLPNSVYTINVTGFTYTGEGDFSQTVNCTVPPGKPSVPKAPLLPEETEVSSTTFPLQILPASDRNGPIGCYHVIVVKSSITDNLPDPDMLQPYGTLEEAKDSGDENIVYIAMALTLDTVGESIEVTVGDGRVTSCKPQQGGRKRRALTADDVYNQEYTNSPLEPDSSYTTSVRAYGPNDGTQPYFSTSQYTDPLSTGPPQPPNSTTLIAIITTVCVVVLLGIVAAAVMYYRRRKKAHRQTANRGLALTNVGDNVEPSGSGTRNGAYATVDDIEKDYRRLSQLETVHDVTKFLEAHGLEELSAKFEEHDVDGRALRGMNDAILKDVIPKAGPRARLTALLMELKTPAKPVTVALFLDLRKAFDTVNHDILLGKLKKLGFDTDVTNWFESYLADRFQTTHLQVMLIVVCIVVEYAPNGCLKDWLTSKSDELNASSEYQNQPVSLSIVPMEQLIQFGIDVANGMSLLAAMTCVHRDLAARNVLLGENLVAKISDFGLSRDIYESSEYVKSTKSKLPLRWMAYESLFYNVYTSQSDVWSFGVLLWEITTMGKQPYKGMNGKRMMDMIKDGGRLEKPTLCPEDVYAIMVTCWETLPEDRPSFPQLKARLDRILQDFKPYTSLLK